MYIVYDYLDGSITIYQEFMKEYKTLLFDIDGTLLDFKKAEDYAMHKTFSDHHLELTSEIFEIYEEIQNYGKILN